MPSVVPITSPIIREDVVSLSISGNMAAANNTSLALSLDADSPHSSDWELLPNGIQLQYHGQAKSMLVVVNIAYDVNNTQDLSLLSILRHNQSDVVYGYSYISYQNGNNFGAQNITYINHAPAVDDYFSIRSFRESGVVTGTTGNVRTAQSHFKVIARL